MGNLHPEVSLHMKGGAVIRFELYPEYAPNAVNSILELIDLKGYENLVIQRIAPDFVLQPWFDEARMDERFHYVMDREIEESFDFGHYTVGMAGDGEKISSCGCIFFVTSDERGRRLNGNFTGVGRVTEGFEEIDRIMNVKLRDVQCDMPGVVVKEPLVPEMIESASYSLNGFVRDNVKKRLELF